MKNTGYSFLNLFFDFLLQSKERLFFPIIRCEIISNLGADVIAFETSRCDIAERTGVNCWRPERNKKNRRTVAYEASESSESARPHHLSIDINRSYFFISGPLLHFIFYRERKREQNRLLIRPDIT